MRIASKSIWKYSNKNSQWCINKRLKKKNHILHTLAVKLFIMLKITYSNIINKKMIMMMKKKKNMMMMMFTTKQCTMMLSHS